jgi:hypothetical protein
VTSVEAPAQGDRWLRAIGYGLLAEISTIITIVVVVALHKFVFARGLSEADYTAFGERVGALVGPVGGTLYTFILARLLMPRLTSRFLAHGVVVALAAIALSVTGSIAGHQGVPAGYLLASALKLIAGALAGVLYARSASQIEQLDKGEAC